MSKVRIVFVPHFQRQFKKLPKKIHKVFALKMEIFSTDIFDTRLRTHKLHGVLADSWAFRLDYDYRIIFRFEKDDIVLVEIGSHEIYEV